LRLQGWRGHDSEFPHVLKAIARSQGTKLLRTNAFGEFPRGVETMDSA